MKKKIIGVIFFLAAIVTILTYFNIKPEITPNIDAPRIELVNKNKGVRPKEIKINDFTTTKKIYGLNEKAEAEIIIYNGLWTPYNITFWWFNETDRLFQWNYSNNETFPHIIYYPIWYHPLKNKGNWRIQALIEYFWENKTQLQEKIIGFEVL